MYKKHTSGLLFTLLLAPWLAVAEPVPEPAGSIQGVLQNLPSACGQPLADVDTTALERLSEFYRRKQFDMLWTSYTQIDALLVQIEALVDDGLEPAAYHPEAIRRAMLTATRDPLHRECSDVLASHAYLSALGHLAQGRQSQQRGDSVTLLTNNPK